MGLLNIESVNRAVNAQGDPVPFAQRYVYLKDSPNLSRLYSDPNLTEMVANPMVADELGYFRSCYLVDAAYRVSIKDPEDRPVLDETEIVLQSAQFFGSSKEFPSVSSLLSDVSLSYGEASSKFQVGSGDTVSVREGRFSYSIAEPAAEDHHLETQGGVKLYVQVCANGYEVKAFGAVGDGVQDDTLPCQKAVAAAGDGEVVIFNGAETYRLTEDLDTSGQSIGKQLHLNGATLFLASDAATIRLGQQGSGLLMGGGEVRARGGFSGSAITLLPQARSSDAARSWFICDANITCTTSTGTAISGRVELEDTRIVGLRASNVTVGGFEYACHLRSAALTGVGFINDNEFVNLRIPGRTPYGIVCEASSSGMNEVSGNKFTNVMTQYFSGLSQRHVHLADDRCRRNKFISYDAWDIGGASTLLVEDNGLETMWFGTIPTSGGVSSFSQSAIGILNKDAGSQNAELMLGEYRRSNSVETRKVQTFSTSDLGTLDVRNGEVMIEGAVTFGTRLSNIIQGGVGQTITILFGGNTLLSHAWGGMGQIQTHNRASRYPAPAETCQFTFDGSAWVEHGRLDAQYQAASISEIEDSSSSWNTIGKFSGRLIWDETNNRMLRAAGGGPSSLWHLVDGTGSVAPS